MCDPPTPMHTPLLGRALTQGPALPNPDWMDSCPDLNEWPAFLGSHRRAAQGPLSLAWF